MNGKMGKEKYLSLRLGARGRTAHCVRAVLDFGAQRCVISEALADKLNLVCRSGYPVVKMYIDGALVSAGSYKHAKLERVYWCPQEIEGVDVTIMGGLSVDMVITGDTYNKLCARQINHVE